MKKDLFCDSVKEKIENSHYYKYQGVVPEGFVMIPEQTLERLKDFDFWKDWKYDPNLLKEFAKKDSKLL